MMNRIRSCLLFLAACAPLSAAAEVMHYSLCSLSGDATIQDVQSWVQDWRVAAGKAGIDYEVRLLVGHAANAEEMPPNFFIEGATPSMESYAQAWNWWYSSDAGAVASNEQLFGLATCGNQAVFRTLE